MPSFVKYIMPEVVLQEDFMDLPAVRISRNDDSADCDLVNNAGDRISAAVAAVFMVPVKEIYATTRRTASVKSSTFATRSFSR